MLHFTELVSLHRLQLTSWVIRILTVQIYCSLNSNNANANNFFSLSDLATLTMSVSSTTTNNPEFMWPCTDLVSLLRLQLTSWVIRVLTVQIYCSLNSYNKAKANNLPMSVPLLWTTGLRGKVNAAQLSQRLRILIDAANRMFEATKRKLGQINLA